MREFLLILLAILLPPVAVLLMRGLGAEFVISIILTLIGWIPGLIYAMFLVLQQPSASPA